MSERWNNYREESKKIIGRNIPLGFRIDDNDLKLGAILRIADALELIAKNYEDLIADRNWYKKSWHEKIKEIEFKDRQIAGLRGYINRLKR